MEYYVDSINGLDNNPGNSETLPFKTLNRVNELELNPGDAVLLKRGSVFKGEGLIIKAKGKEGAKITFDSYGEGEIPRIEADGNNCWYMDYGCFLDAKTHVYKGTVSSAVLIMDASYIAVKNLEITNAEVNGKDLFAPDRMNRTGVAIVAKDSGNLYDIELEGLFIHDVHGNIYDKHLANGGIYGVCLSPTDESKTGIARIDGLRIANNTVTDSFRWGIAACYTYRHKDYIGKELDREIFKSSGILNLQIVNNYVERIGGDGITAMYALEPNVSHNTVVSVAMHMNKVIYKYPGERRGMVAAGVWPWKCKDAAITYNEVLDTRLNQDGQAYDCDSGDGTIYEHNYSYGNEGGAVMFCMEEAVNNIFRNNISECDLVGIISPADNPDALVEKNTFLLLGDTPIIRHMENPGKYDLVENTIIKE